MSNLPVIIDCDTGIDDALALVLACSSPLIDIIGVTTVAGNVDCDNTTRNTENVLHLLGRDDIPVARGAEKPLQRTLLKASGVHGKSGLRGYDFEKDYTGALVKAEPAWDFQKKLLEKSSERVTIIALGPVTNIAILFDFYPEIQTESRKDCFHGYFLLYRKSYATFHIQCLGGSRSISQGDI